MPAVFWQNLHLIQGCAKRIPVGIQKWGHCNLRKTEGLKIATPCQGHYSRKSGMQSAQACAILPRLPA